MPRLRFKTPVFSRLCGFCQLFPLHRCGGFGGDVVEDAVDALDLVYDAVGDLVQHLKGDAGPVGGHKVAGNLYNWDNTAKYG